MPSPALFARVAKPANGRERKVKLRHHPKRLKVDSLGRLALLQAGQWKGWATSSFLETESLVLHDNNGA